MRPAISVSAGARPPVDPELTARRPRNKLSVENCLFKNGYSAAARGSQPARHSTLNTHLRGRPHTLLLDGLHRGEPGAAAALLAQVYGELRQLGRAKFAEIKDFAVKGCPDSPAIYA
jgi:hypothetical protein